MVDENQIMEALKEVKDPELDVDIVTLELIRDISIEKDHVTVKMTFTSPMCPYGPTIVEMVEQEVGSLESVKDVSVDLSFDPPWKPSEDLRAILGV
jgi:metal-sulfur cluster biosynthetic enzyme